MVSVCRQFIIFYSFTATDRRRFTNSCFKIFFCGLTDFRTPLHYFFYQRDLQAFFYQWGQSRLMIDKKVEESVSFTFQPPLVKQDTTSLSVSSSELTDVYRIELNQLLRRRREEKGIENTNTVCGEESDYYPNFDGNFFFAFDTCKFVMTNLALEYPTKIADGATKKGKEGEGAKIDTRTKYTATGLIRVSDLIVFGMLRSNPPRPDTHDGFLDTPRENMGRFPFVNFKMPFEFTYYYDSGPSNTNELLRREGPLQKRLIKNASQNLEGLFEDQPDLLMNILKSAK